MTARVALVTGVTGQDGGYLVEQLVAAGATVCGLMREGETAPEHLRSLRGPVTLRAVNIHDDGDLLQALQAYEPTEIYNLAGVSSVARSWETPGVTAAVNGGVVARLLQLVWQEQERRSVDISFVQASSAEIFAGSRTSPQDEETPVRPTSPYGASKAFAHHLVQVFRSRGLRASNAILYNHESPRRPSTFVTRKITSAVAAIADGCAQQLVLGNLDARRDWGWAPEYVDAMTRLAAQDQGLDVVVATGVAHSVTDFVTCAFAHVGISDWDRYVLTDPQFVRPADAVELVGDPSLAKRQLGWEPRVSFEELVGRMVDADRQQREVICGR